MLKHLQKHMVGLENETISLYKVLSSIYSIVLRVVWNAKMPSLVSAPVAQRDQELLLF